MNPPLEVWIFGNIEDYSFTQLFDIISITDKEIVVQEKDETV